MNIDFLGYDPMDDLRDLRNIAGSNPTNDRTDRNIGGVIETGITSAADVLTAFFGYRTAALDTTPIGNTVSPASNTPAGASDGTKTALIIGGSALAAVVAIMALK